MVSAARPGDGDCLLRRIDGGAPRPERWRPSRCRQHPRHRRCPGADRCRVARAVSVTTRPATRADASEIALLVNIAVHGGIAQGWAHAPEAQGTYDPIEVGRLEML